MNQFEIPTIIEKELPDICEELQKTSVFGDAIKSMQILANYSKSLLTTHDLSKLLKCMRLIGKIYDRGNSSVKNAIESVYVFSFSAMQAACNKIEWNVIRAKMPITLYTLYMRQLYSKGI